MLFNFLKMVLYHVKLVGDGDGAEITEAQQTNSEPSAETVTDNNMILQVTIHRTDKLKSDLRIIHPVVRINIVDLDNGKCLKKQTRYMLFGTISHVFEVMV